jgi:hypothetical protein
MIDKPVINRYGNANDQRVPFHYFKTIKSELVQLPHL